MVSEKFPYLKNEPAGLFKKWCLHEKAEGCEMVLEPAMCLRMDKRPPLPAGTVAPAAVAVATPAKTAPPPPAAPEPYKAPAFVYRLLGVHDAPVKEKPTTAPQKTAKRPPPFELADLPKAMEAEGFTVAARFAKRWLEGAAYKAKQVEPAIGKPVVWAYDAEHIDTKSIKLNELLTYPRIAQRYQGLLDSLRSSNAAEVIRRIVKNNYATHSTQWSGWFDTASMLSADPQAFHQRFQFQFAAVSMADTLLPLEAKYARRYGNNLGMSDVSAALGNFVLYAAIAKGQVQHDELRGLACFPLKRPRVVIQDIYVYARDTYSFEDAGASSQYLGHWNKTGLVIMPQSALGSWLTKLLDDVRDEDRTLPDVRFEPGQHPVPHLPIDIGGQFAERHVYYPLRNRDFTTWREKTQLGADFVIFSNFKRIQLQTPIMVDLA
jgi:hypothetical protein